MVGKNPSTNGFDLEVVPCAADECPNEGHGLGDDGPLGHLLAEPFQDPAFQGTKDFLADVRSDDLFRGLLAEAYPKLLKDLADCCCPRQRDEEVMPPVWIRIDLWSIANSRVC